MEPQVKITFSGWREGMKSLRFARLLHDVAGLGLAEAWRIKTQVLEEEPVVLALPVSLAAAVWEQATALGVICFVDHA
ncbi:hypothetical protein GCM10028824_13300 [Hymenobacter segetis]|uniref:Ribosomal protein L7/L12 C-terminal domain-containing protein n=1 Tax=Hymenobacter segetis TaxID=2025509 RepID=A0ABU9M158_9BACT